MATVIDSLVVELSLSAEQFKKAQREALEAFRKTQEDAVKGGKEIEDQSKKSMEALGGIKTQALELFTALGGGAAVIAFATKITTADAAVGRLSRNIGVSVGDISKWQGAAHIFGGSAEGMAQSFTAISDAVAGWKIGKISPLIAEFRALSTAGGTVIDVNKGVDQTLLDISANLKAVHDRDPATAGLLSRAIGLDPGLADLMFQGPEATRVVLARVNALGPATKEAADRAGDLAKAWNSVGLAVEGAGRPALTTLGPALADALNATAKDISGDRSYVGLGKIEETGFSGFWETLKQGLTWTSSSKPSAAAPSIISGAGGAGGSRGDRNNNPGNMKDGAFARSHGATGNDGGFAVFPDWATGSAAQEALVRGSSYQGLTLDQFAQKYAEGSSAWRNTVGGALGIGGRDIVNNQDPRLIDAIRRAEGTGHGAVRVGIGSLAGIDHGGGSTTTTHVTINGLNVTAPQGSDPTDFANRFAAAVKRQSYAAQANDGQN